MLQLDSRNLFLIGPTATGKTSTGRQLAGQLNLRFMDSDHEIEARTGVDIQQIFDLEGEAGFRTREQQVIANLTKGTRLLLATGAGAILSETNRMHLASRGFVVFLDTSIEMQLTRAGKGKGRPLLSGPNPEEVLIKMRVERHSLYENLADLYYFVGNKTRNRVVRELLLELEKAGYPVVSAEPG